jgi:uncharacterized protein
MKFEILAEKNSDDKRAFIYDNMFNTLTSEEGVVYKLSDPVVTDRPHVIPFSKDLPLKKSKTIRKLKIQMGLSCNYSCDYCSQKFVGRPPETSKKDIEEFLRKLEVLDFDENKGLSIEFWGGEPFVYWKTMRPLAEALIEKFSHWKRVPKLSVITNGSILTTEICQWLMWNGFYVSISHDGPGQSVRGPDPFEDPKNKKIVLDFYKKMKPMGRISFNSMLNSKNKSRKEIYDWFVNFTGDENVPLGEGGLIDAYDADGANNILTTKIEHFEFRKQAFNDIYSTQGKIGFGQILQKVDNFTDAILKQGRADYLGQKCGMDDPEVLAIDMKGNVLTCQNVSAVETAMNGESHKGGNLDDYDNVSLKAATHWKNRVDCDACPVLHLCKGSCMFLEDEYWDSTCNNAYSDNIVLFALAIEKITGGYIPYYINSTEKREDRKDIWGTIMQHDETPKRKIIPIKSISEKTVLDDVEVYTQAKVELNANI